MMGFGLIFLQNVLIYTIKHFFNYSSTSVVYSSDNIIVLNKQFDLKINSNNKREYTVQSFMKTKYPLVASKKLFHEYYFVHRLDYATSGIMCIPVHKKACQYFSNAFYTRQTKKYYVAIVRGWFSKETFDVNIPIGEDARFGETQKMCTADLDHCIKFREARTLILVLERGLYDNYPATKILIRPITGRRHQIRVHCNFLGHTVVGDYTYSNKKDTKPFRMFLHSLRLTLPNPIENLDVQTADPFTKTLRMWEPIEVLNCINRNAFNKIDSEV